MLGIRHLTEKILLPASVGINPYLGSSCVLRGDTNVHSHVQGSTIKSHHMLVLQIIYKGKKSPKELKFWWLVFYLLDKTHQVAKGNANSFS